MEPKLNLADKGAINYALQLLRDKISDKTLGVDTLMTPEFIDGLIVKVWSVK
jgi:hypothetical protein